jgi:hypothetical protein
MNWNDVQTWTPELIEQYLDEHPRWDGNRELAREILLADIEREREDVTFDVMRAGGGESLLTDGPVATREEAARLADDICENIRQQAIERDGVDPGYDADDVEIVEIR